jgi:hypothetical protein
MTLLIIIFILSLGAIVGILVWQWKKVEKGEVIITPEILQNKNKNKPVTIRDIGILVIYIIKHAIQALVLGVTKIYFIIKKKILIIANSRVPKIVKSVKGLKLPPVPTPVKAFVKKSIDDTKYKIQKIKKRFGTSRRFDRQKSGLTSTFFVFYINIIIIFQNKDQFFHYLD